MSYVEKFDRNQIMMCSWDIFVEPESIARLIDAFVNSLDMLKYTEKGTSWEGRPAYDPRSLYKLYIYGNRKGIRSSRKLADACRVNLEVKWMTGGIEPDFRTISDFRKDNIDSMKEIFHEFNRRISGAVEWGFASVDGSKFHAVNSKNANFTKNKLDDRIRWLNAHTDEYLRILEEMDEQEDMEETPEQLTREVIESKLEEARERLKRYESYQKLMEETGASQLSLTDADARLMKDKEGFSVSYNPQTAVDSETHIIRDFNMTNQVTDHGQLMPTMEGIREESTDGVIDVVADKGYEQPEDMIECLENGIIPHVITDDGKDGYDLEIPYVESQDADVTSTEPEELKKCLHAGKIPDAYADVVTKAEVKEVRRMVKDETEAVEEPKSIYGTPEEMQERAKEGYFVRDPERNLVYCPGGEILRQKSIKKNGNIRYSNKNACRHCKNRNQCYKGKNEWKEIDFSKDCLEKPCKDWPKVVEAEKAENTAEVGSAEKAAEEKPKAKRRYEKVKIVKLFLKPDRQKTEQRMCLSEHPFGTIKRSMGADYFLLKGMRKVTGEFALFCLGYNLIRAKNLLGFDKMMELMAG
ncbi:MAG: transposase [Clostridiales bacterium]|nr:transposase [Clostridiales bacterium]